MEMNEVLHEIKSPLQTAKLAHVSYTHAHTHTHSRVSQENVGA